MYKNWQAIARIEDEVARTALMLATNPVTLDALRRGWPECFTHTPQSSPVPKSAILTLIEPTVRYIHEIDDSRDAENLVKLVKWYRQYRWWDVLSERFGVPYIATFGYDFGDEFPAEICEQLIGRTCQAGDLLTYQGGQVLVAAVGGCDYDGEIIDGEVLKNMMEFVIVSPDFVDLEA